MHTTSIDLRKVYESDILIYLLHPDRDQVHPLLRLKQIYQAIIQHARLLIFLYGSYLTHYQYVSKNLHNGRLRYHGPI